MYVRARACLHTSVHVRVHVRSHLPPPPLALLVVYLQVSGSVSEMRSACVRNCVLAYTYTPAHAHTRANLTCLHAPLLIVAVHLRDLRTIMRHSIICPSICLHNDRPNLYSSEPPVYATPILSSAGFVLMFSNWFWCTYLFLFASSYRQPSPLPRHASMRRTSHSIICS